MRSGIFLSYRELLIFSISRSIYKRTSFIFDKRIPGEIHTVYKEIVFLPFQNTLLHAIWTRWQHEISVYLNWNATRVTRERVASSQRTGNHRTRTRTRACCIFYILLTFTPDTVRSLVLSECRQKVWRFRGERQDRVGSQVLYFLHGRGLCGCDCGVARFVRYADRSGLRARHLLTSSLICDSARFRPTSGYLPLSFSFYACNNRNIIFYLKKKW